MWIPSPPQRVIGPAAYYPLEGGGIMKEPPPSLIVAGQNSGVEASKSCMGESAEKQERVADELGMDMEEGSP